MWSSPLLLFVCLLAATSAYVTPTRNVEKKSVTPAANPKTDAYYAKLRRSRINKAIENILGGLHFYHVNEYAYPHTLSNNVGPEAEIYPAVVTDYYEVSDNYKPELYQKPLDKYDPDYIKKILDLNEVLNSRKASFDYDDATKTEEEESSGGEDEDGEKAGEIGPQAYDNKGDTPFALRAREANFQLEVDYDDITSTKPDYITKSPLLSKLTSTLFPPFLPKAAELVFEDIRQQRQNPNLKPRQRGKIDDNQSLLFSSNSDVSIPISLIPPNNQQLEMLRRAQTESGGGVKILSTRPKESVFGIALIATITLSAFLAFLTFAIGWYFWSKRAKEAAEAEYPAYGVTGPDLAGDRKLAHAAHMYHYQHHKQQIIAMERGGPMDDNSISDLESDEDNVEGDYTVYECPGLATTGEMEVKNPLFTDVATQVIPPNILAPLPIPKLGSQK